MALLMAFMQAKTLSWYCRSSSQDLVISTAVNDLQFQFVDIRRFVDSSVIDRVIGLVVRFMGVRW